MADDVGQKSSVPLPPKLDLRRSSVVKPAPVAAAGGTVPSREAPVVDVSSTTMHIKLQDTIPTVKIAPSPGLAAGAGVQARPSPTIEVKRPVVMPSPPPGVAVKPLTVSPAPAPVVAPAVPPMAEKKLSSKSETSRIPLELATSIAPAAVLGKPAGDLKTIKIKPSPGTIGVKVPAPVVAPPPAPAGRPMDDKRKTSRISLESALAMEDKGADKGAPKTIRLKRPGESTAKASPTLDTITASPGVGKPAAGQTARLDDVPTEEEEGPTPTRRKTIKVKRLTDSRPGVSVAAGGMIEGPGIVQGAAAEEVAAETRVGVFDWLAFVAALLTIIMTFVIMFMLAAQAWGPNPCLTELSSWKTGPNFSWTGKTMPLLQ